MKQAYYFSHDSNAKTDEKILELRSEFGWEGYGIYWALLEILYDTSGNKFPFKSLPGLSINLGVKKEKLISIVKNFSLFSFDDEFFWSDSLIRRVEAQKEKSAKARRSAEIKWSKRNANAEQTHSERIAVAVQPESEGNAIKESKGKERKRKESIDKRDHLFKDSEFYDFEKFQQQFEGTDYAFCDLKIYYEKVKNWSASGGKKKVDWIATARNFMLGDKEKNCLILKPGVNGQAGTQTNFGADVDSYLNKKYGGSAA
jgi:hypothetical protein